jgi:formamidopyrimidine-DNA glycosylase
MPELPDVVVYIQCLEPRILHRRLERIRLTSPFLLRTVTPSLREAEGKSVIELRRLGKRIVIGLDGDLFLVMHLMIAGRLRWRDLGATPPKRRGLAAFDFEIGTLLLTEAGTQKRSSLHVVRGERELAKHDPGGLEVLDSSIEDFRGAILRENHTLKRALTDPRILSGIGNAYSDEILHAARLSPVKLTSALSPEETARLHDAIRETLTSWIRRSRREAGEGFPEQVTAFREGMAVHGRFGQPCPTCGAPVQRIVYASNEVNYCARCQTDGRLLADRALSRLLRKDWPKTLDQWEGRLGSAPPPANG